MVTKATPMRFTEYERFQIEYIMGELIHDGYRWPKGHPTMIDVIRYLLNEETDRRHQMLQDERRRQESDR